MILVNLGLVHSLCSRFVGRGVDYEDLFQAGCEGLTKAALGYDKNLGFAFSTYAVPYILGELKKVVRENRNLKISRSTYTLYGKIMAAKEELYIKCGRVPSVNQLAAYMQISVEKVIEALQSGEREVSIYTDQMAAEIPVPEDSFEKLQDREWINSALNALPEKEQLLIILRYFRSLSQCKTGEVLGMSQVQVSRMERRILKKIKDFLET